MNLIRKNLRLDLSRPWMVWALFAGGVAAYWLLVLLEALGVWNMRAGALTPSWWWTQVLIFGGVSIGGANRHEALAMPLSFTLPGYRESLRRASFVRAVRWGVLFALFAFSQEWWELQSSWNYPADIEKPSSMMEPGIVEISLSMVGGYLTGMVTCLLWVNSQLLRSRRRWSVILLTGGIIGVAYVEVFHGDRHPFVIWPIVIPLSILFCGFFWWRLGDREWVKSGHRGTLTHKIGGSWGIELRTAVVSCRSQSLRGADTGTAVSWWKDLLLSGMRKGNVRAAARHALGWFYRVFGPTLARWKWIAVSLLVGVLVLGYLNRLFVGMAFLFLGLPIAGEVWQLSSTMLLPEGRREQYYLTLVSGAGATLLLTAVSVGAVALSWLFAALLPPIPLGTHPLEYTGFSLKNVWLACLPVPWFPVILLILGVMLISFRLVVPLLLLFIAMYFMGSRLSALHVDPNLWSSLLPILLACGWVFFLSIVWIKYRRWDLAGE